MKLSQKMEIVKVDGFSCNDNVILTVCNWYFQEYCDVFWNIFQFGYRLSEKVGDGFEKSDFSVLRNVLEMYGLTFSIAYKRYTSDVYYFMKQKLHDREVLILEIDIFYCPWATDYKKRHNTHTVILTAVDEDICKCVDPAFKKVDVELPLQCVEMGFLQLIEPIYEQSFEGKALKKRYSRKWQKRMLRSIFYGGKKRVLMLLSKRERYGEIGI